MVACGLGAQTLEPRVYNRVFSVEGQKLEALPYEKVRQGGKKEQREAWIEGGRSAARFKQGSEPVLVIAYWAGDVPEWAARFYRMGTDGKVRRVRLGVSPGVAPLKMENYGKLSKRLIVPRGLGQGEYAISNPSGSFAYTFGVD